MRNTSLPRNILAALLVAAFAVASLGLGATTAHANPPPVIVAKPNEHSVQVLRVQSLLVALKKMQPGFNDGYYTWFTVDAIRKVQAEAKLPVTGVTDKATYDYLVGVWAARGRPPAPNPVYAREGSRGIVVLRFQNILVGIKKLAPGYNTGTYDAMTRNAVQALQRDEGLPITGEMNLVTYKRFLVKWYAMGRPLPASKPAAKPAPKPGVKLDKRCLVGAKVICINKSARKLYFVTNGRIQRSWDIRVGRAGYATREGTFTVFRKELKSWSKPYQVWMPYSMYFSGGQAIHFSYEFANHGYLQGSHGCVNMRDWNGIAWLYKQSPVGTKLVVYH